MKVTTLRHLKLLYKVFIEEGDSFCIFVRSTACEVELPVLGDGLFDRHCKSQTHSYNIKKRRVLVFCSVSVLSKCFEMLIILRIFLKL